MILPVGFSHSCILRTHRFTLYILTYLYRAQAFPAISLRVGQSELYLDNRRPFSKLYGFPDKSRERKCFLTIAKGSASSRLNPIDNSLKNKEYEQNLVQIIIVH